MSSNFLDKDGNVVGPIDFNLTLGRKAAALTRSVSLSTEDLAAVNAIATALAGTLTVTANVGTGTQPVSGTITANAGTGTMAVSAASLPLPTGAATAANQTAFNALFPSSLGTKTAANSLAVTLASDGALTTAFGAQADTSATTDTGTFSLIALIKRAVVYLGNISTAALDTTTASPVSARQPCDVVPLTPTLDTVAYASGDTLFVTTAISGAVRANDERALLQSIALIDKAKNNPAMTLFFFKSNVTFGTINAAPSLSDADAVSYLGHVAIAAADWVTLANNSLCVKAGINLLLESATGTTTVYIAAMLTAGTPTYAASDLVLNFGLLWS